MMKKLCFAVALFFGIYTHSQAQFLVGGHIGPAFPIGEFADGVKVGFGLGAEGKYMFNENIAFGLGISWYNFNTKSGVDDLDFNITPFLFSVDYFIPQSSGFTPYAGLGLGLYRLAYKYDQFTLSETKFGIAPTLGALYPLNDQIDINVNLKLNFVFTENETTVFIPLNVGVLVSIP